MESFGREFERHSQPAFENIEQAKEGEMKVENLLETMKEKKVESVEFSNTSTQLSLVESENTGGEPSVVISWESGSYVKFVPITEGVGSEKGVFGYTGYYGYKDGEKTEEIPLESALRNTDSADISTPEIRFHLTDAAFAVEKNFAEENTFDVWVGVGMLAIDERHSHLIHHELGHVDKEIQENNFADESPDKEYQASSRARKMTTGLQSESNYPGSGVRGLFGMERDGTGVAKKDRRYLQIMEWGGSLSRTEAGKRVDSSAQLFATNSKDKMVDQIEKARKVFKQTELSLLWTS